MHVVTIACSRTYVCLVCGPRCSPSLSLSLSLSEPPISDPQHGFNKFHFDNVSNIAHLYQLSATGPCGHRRSRLRDTGSALHALAAVPDLSPFSNCPRTTAQADAGRADGPVGCAGTVLLLRPVVGRAAAGLLPPGPDPPVRAGPDGVRGGAGPRQLRALHAERRVRPAAVPEAAPVAGQPDGDGTLPTVTRAADRGRDYPLSSAPGATGGRTAHGGAFADGRVSFSLIVTVGFLVCNKTHKTRPKS